MLLEEIENKKILISPLNWGMGHVSRCIALINKLKTKNQITVACDQHQKEIFEQYHAEVNYTYIEGYPFNFQSNRSFEWNLAKDFNTLKKHIAHDHIQCEEICNLEKIDLVISDHRYGFYSQKIESIFLTHQVNLPLPWFLSFVNFYHQTLIKKFTKLWIVDDPLLNLAGKLSKPVNFISCYYVGILSRFYNQEIFQSKKGHYLLITGPSAYWKHLINSFKETTFDGILCPKEFKVEFQYLKVPFYPISDWDKIDSILRSSRKISGYSGYSTIMDLHYLNCEFDLIPCPGQREQEFLQKELYSKKNGHL